MSGQQYKIVITGTMGSGKTTAISAISGVKTISTDVRTSNAGESNIKPTTTAAMDYGELVLDEGEVLRLYGTPGQERFEYMWGILARGALGLIVLVDNSRADPLADAEMYLNNFAELIANTGAVIGVGRLDTHPAPGLDDYSEMLMRRDLAIPVLSVDVRKRDDVMQMLDALLSTLEANIDE